MSHQAGSVGTGTPRLGVSLISATHMAEENQQIPAESPLISTHKEKWGRRNGSVVKGKLIVTLLVVNTKVEGTVIDRGLELGLCL